MLFGKTKVKLGTCYALTRIAHGLDQVDEIVPDFRIRDGLRKERYDVCYQRWIHFHTGSGATKAPRDPGPDPFRDGPSGHGLRAVLTHGAS